MAMNLSALPTHALRRSTPPSVDVRVFQRVSANAMSFLKVWTRNAITPDVILCVSHGFKVARVDAKAIAAKMIAFNFARRNNFHKKLVGRSMGRKHDTGSNAKTSIARTVGCSRPNPTRYSIELNSRIDPYLAKESSQKFPIDGKSVSIIVSQGMNLLRQGLALVRPANETQSHLWAARILA